MREPIHLISTQDTESIVTEMATILKRELGEIISHENNIYEEFNNEETNPILEQSVLGKHTYIIGDVNGKHSVKDLTVRYNDRLMQLLLLTQNAKIHGAKTTNVIPTCFPYSRGDGPVQGGLKERVEKKPASAQFIVDVFQDLLNVDYCITIDVHNPTTINNSKKTKFVNLYTGWHVQHALEQIKKEHPTLSGTDEGSHKKVSSIARDLGLDYLTVFKKKNYSKSGTVEEIFVYGNVAGRDILVCDDILDTGGSQVRLIEKIQSMHPKSINICITHCLLNKDAIEKLTKLHEQGMFENIYITTSVCRENYPPFVKFISVAPIFANTIKDLAIGKDINYNFGVKPIIIPEKKI